LLYKNVKIKIYIAITWPLVLYGFENWSFTLREECRLRVFENRAMKRVFGPKMEEVRGVWRKIHNEELHNLYASTVISSRSMKWLWN
jgi:hypothetical protein